MKNRKIILIGFMIANIALVGLFANNTSADISAYDDNYESLTFSNYGGGAAVAGKPDSVKLPIVAYYTPSFPYTFTLSNVDSNIILSDEVYETSIYEVGATTESEQFSLSVLGNEGEDKNVTIHIDYEPVFYSKTNSSKSSNIPITYVAGYKIGSDSSAIPEYTFTANSVVNNLEQYSSSYTRVPYSLYLNGGPQDLLLLEFNFTWPAINESNFPDGFYSRELLRSNVLINITT